MNPSRKRGLIVILDGLGDQPNPDLDGRTPLEAAHTPTLDRLVERGRCGVTDPLRPGTPVDTPTGTAVLFGVPSAEADALARGPVEAAGVSLDVQPGDVVIRCNFATMERDDGGGLIITDRRAGRIRRDTLALAMALGDLDLGDGVTATVRPASQHRGVVRLRGAGLSAAITDTDPGVAHGPVSVLPCRPLEPNDRAAVRTAAAVDRFVAMSFEKLYGHPVNQRRREAGLHPASGIVTRGAGQATSLRSAASDRGLRTTLVAGERTVVGLGRLLGFEVLAEPTFSGLPDTDLDGKAEATLTALSHSDLVYLHIKAPDIHAHDLDPVGKARTLERIDVALSALPLEDLVVGVCGDHCTSSLLGDHTGDPVPALLAIPGAARDTQNSFGEESCRHGGLGRLAAEDFVRRVLDALRSDPLAIRPREA